MNAGKGFVSGARMILFWVLAFYFVLVAILYFNQKKLLFFPDSNDGFLEQNITPFQILTLYTEDGLALKNLWYPAKDGNPTIVYFHGNAGNAAGRIMKARYFIARGYGVALVEYPGYGGNPGIPSEKNLYADARQAIKAVKEKGVRIQDTVLYGESLGTGVATQMALEHPNARALVLEAPYTSIADVAASHYWFVPVHLLLTERFESSRKIGQLRMPVLILHGEKDRTIPVRFGKKLFSLVTAKQKELVILEHASHNDIYDYGAEETIHGFLSKIQ
ncbi:MAG: hypothetical protein JWM96_970 [Alphaproteobacteria bacterium]|nr:hypothetical protein [Alphaproteobacteria bacterium]